MTEPQPPTETATIELGGRPAVINGKPYSIRDIEIIAAANPATGHLIPIDAYAHATLENTTYERRLHVGLAQPEALDAADRLVTAQLAQDAGDDAEGGKTLKAKGKGKPKSGNKNKTGGKGKGSRK